MSDWISTRATRLLETLRCYFTNNSLSHCHIPIFANANANIRCINSGKFCAGAYLVHVDFVEGFAPGEDSGGTSMAEGDFLAGENSGVIGVIRHENRVSGVPYEICNEAKLTRCLIEEEANVLSGKFALILAGTAESFTVNLPLYLYVCSRGVKPSTKCWLTCSKSY